MKHNTTSTPTMACTKFISQAVEMLMERDNLEHHEALAQAERMAMDEGLMPSPIANAKLRKVRFVNATLGEQVQHTFAVVKRAKATSGLASDCLTRNGEFS